MSVNRRVGLGFTLGMDPTGGTSYTVLGAIVDGWKGGGAKKHAIETALLSDTWMTFGVGQIDPGEVTFVIAYDPDDSASTVPLVTNLASTSQVAANFQVTFPNGASGSGVIQHETFRGFVVGVNRDIDRGKLLTAEVTIKVTGDVGYANV